MGGRINFIDSNSQRAKAALVASRHLNEAADKARALEGRGVHGCNQTAQARHQFKGTNKEAMRLPCPHCRHPSVIRTSEQMTTLMRQYVFCCVNPECGHTFVGTLEISRTLSPSATPDPSVNLPLSSHVRRDMLRAQLDHAGTSEHVTRSTAPVTGDLFMQGAPPAD